MKKHIVLLRGVNVSGSNIIKMAELKKSLIDDGFNEVTTYIQSGNIVLSSDLPKEEVSSKIRELIKADFNLDVPVIALSKEEVQQIKDNNPFKEVEDKCYFVFLFDQPLAENCDKLGENSYPNEEYEIRDKVIYLYPKLGAGKAKLNNNVFENKLKITATARNLNTVNKLLELAD